MSTPLKTALDKDTKTSGVTLITSFGKWNETRRKTQNGTHDGPPVPAHTRTTGHVKIFFSPCCMERPWELSCSTELTAAMYHMSSRVSVLSVPRVLCHMFCILCTKRIVGGGVGRRGLTRSQLRVLTMEGIIVSLALKGTVVTVRKIRAKKIIIINKQSRHLGLQRPNLDCS